MLSKTNNIITKRFISILLTLSLLLCISCLSTFAGEDTVGVNIPKIKQQTDYYCGAACGVSVLSYYNTIVTQSAFANYVSNNPTSGLTLEQIKNGLSYWGNVNSTQAESTISFSTVYSNINAGRPIIAGFHFFTQGHVVVLCGATISTNSVIYMNPATGSMVGETYSSFKNGYTLNLPWEDTLYRMYKS